MPQLGEELLRLWHREFDRFPAGHFVQSDFSAMVLYLQTLADYEAARCRIQDASSASIRDERREARAITRQLISLLRALRMFPSTRAHPTSMSRLAHQPIEQFTQDMEIPFWRKIVPGMNTSKPD